MTETMQDGQFVKNEVLQKQQDSISEEEKALYVLESEFRSLKKSPYYILGRRFVKILEEIQKLHFGKLWTSYRNVKRQSMFLQQFTDVKPHKADFKIPFGSNQNTERITFIPALPVAMMSLESHW